MPQASLPSASGSVFIQNTLVKVAYDYIDVDESGGTTDVFTYKSGGSGGSTVATVTVTYTDATKQNIDFVTQT